MSATSIKTFFSVTFFSLIPLFYPVLLGQNTSGQEPVPHYPEQFSQFINSYSFVNPSYIGTKEDFGVEMGNRSFANNIGDRSSTFFSIFLDVNDKNQKQANSHKIGLNFYNNQSGPVFNRSRFYFLYSVQIPLTDSLQLAGGLGAGGLNYSVQAQNTIYVQSASELVGDIKGGIWLKGAKFYLGYSVNQALNNTFRLYDQQIALSRYHNFMGGYKLRVGENIRLEPSVYFVLFQQQSSQPGISRPSQLNVNLLATLRDKLKGGLTFQRAANMAPMIGIEKVNVFSGKLDAMLSYSLPIQENRNSNRNVFGLSIGYYFGNDQ